MIKPKQLKKGDTIGIVSPASGLWERSALWSAIEFFENCGYQVKLAKNVYKNTFYFAGSDEERAEGVRSMFEDDSVDAIFCTQGGYGSARIWKLIDFEMIKSNPKIFLGYSDITALHLAIQKMTGLVTFHGPDLLDFSNQERTPYKYDGLMKALTFDEPVGTIKMSQSNKYLVKIVPGRVTGPVIGGNISLICGTMGTPYEIDTRGKILFIEDLDVEPWIMDHFLTHMLNAGKFHDAIGVVIGECVNCDPKKLYPGFYNQRSLENVIFEIFEPLGKPTILGLPIGHTKDIATIPLGVQCELDATKGEFRIIEKGVIE
ncbi:LD-carboxypeptidase [bacterium]|nr:LD-carboxypeptidase [bacterium]